MRIAFNMVVLLITFNLFANSNSHKQKPTEKEQAQFTERFNGSGLRFTPNKGQIADMNGKLCPDVLYKGDGGGADIYIRKTGISYVYSDVSKVTHEIEEQIEEAEKAGKVSPTTKQKMKDELMQKLSIKIHRVDMNFAGSNANTGTINEDEVDGYNNYYYAHCPQGITNVKQYNKIICKNIYNNIDVIYYGNRATGIKYDIIVQPHADPNQIKLYWKGAESIRINSEGALIIKTSVNEFSESIPKVYQNINGKIVDVKAKYVLTPVTEGEAIINFSLADFNASYPLVIDPWATYYGGSNNDYSAGITNDNLGNVAITGFTESFNFPMLGASQTTNSGLSDAFVVKFNPTGTRIWATYYGGSRFDYGNCITSDLSNNILISGHTDSSDLPIVNGFQTSHGGGTYDIFVVKFNPTGTRSWSTYYGGIADDIGRGIVTDKSEDVYISGNTASSDFPVQGGYQMTYAGGNKDAFIVKLKSTGGRNWATFYGGTSDDYANCVTIDISGNVVFSGYTNSIDFPITTGAFQINYGGNADVIIVKLKSDGSRLWATYYGGTSVEEGKSIAIDSQGNIVVAGYTSSADFPVINGFQMAMAGGWSDAFVLNLDSLGTPAWSTFYGTIEYEWAWGITTDKKNNIYLLMEAEDVATPSLVDTCTWQPIFNGGSGNPIGGTVEDLLIIKFTSKGQKVCATYLGGTGEDDMDYGGGMTIFGNSIYITASTDGGYPVTTGAFQTSPGSTNTGLWYGGADAFINEICINFCEGKSLALDYTTNTSLCENKPITYTSVIGHSCDTTGYKFQWSFPDGNPLTSTETNPVVTYNKSGKYSGKLVLITLCKKDSIEHTQFVTVLPTIVQNDLPFKQTINKGGSVSLNLVGGFSYNWVPSTGLSCTNCQNPVASPIVSTTYTVTSTDPNGCKTTTIFEIIVGTPCEDETDLFVPNIFSPNNDGKNDILFVEGNGLTNIYFGIYNRWGNLIFEAFDQSHGWDGTKKGNPMETGTYVYYLKGNCTKTNTEVRLKGNVSLIR
ncbi:MAG: SBBP repeat-containing protein [Bacteroidetes bacterium]|nr:SBBP repeat-containing protein [Bacteroidota bacterium]